VSLDVDLLALNHPPFITHTSIFHPADTKTLQQMKTDGRWPNVNKNTLTDKWGLLYTPLAYAASIGSSEVVRVLLDDLKANPNEPKEFGVTQSDRRPPVVAASAGGHINVLRKIAGTQGCDVDATGPGGYTACYGSAQNGQAACLRILLEFGADPNKAIIDGTTPAMKASLNGHTACLNLLIDYGCDPHHVKDGRPAFLHHCLLL
jgi:ankyrin repeat protein